jgi:hypothetical protein
MKKSSAIILVILIAVIAVGVWQRFIRDDFNLPRGGETKKETIVVQDGQVVGTKEISQETKEIMITNGVKHSVPLDSIVGGGPPKDGIPSIDKPKFISVSEASKWLPDNEPGIAFEIDNINRFYPFQILVWHEIVNDTINGKRVLVTYCPPMFVGNCF